MAFLLAPGDRRRALAARSRAIRSSLQPAAELGAEGDGRVLPFRVEGSQVVGIDVVVFARPVGFSTVRR